MKEATLRAIDELALAHSARRKILLGVLQQLDRDIEALKKKHAKNLARCVELAAETECALRQAVAAVPEAFAKPKTLVLHGIKVGYRKGPGGLDWEDDEDLVRKIERLFPDDDEAARYLIVKKKPSAEALEDLDATTLKRLGVVVVDTGEQVVVKPVESEVEKLVKALLKDAREDAEGE